MGLDANILQEKLIEAWKLRSDETSFSASLSPLVAECRSEEEFRTLFTKQILEHIDSAISSNLLQSYFKFHTRAGYVNESLVIERLLTLKPSSSSIVDDIQIKFLLELLSDILKTKHITAEQASHLGKQINLLAKWLCSALLIYSNEEMTLSRKEMLTVVSKLFLQFFTNTSYYCLWLMTIKAQKEQTEWRQLQEELNQVAQKPIIEDSTRPDVYEEILFKITRLHLSEDFHQEEIEFNPCIFNSIISMLVVNQLHKSSSILLIVLRFYECVSTMSNPSLLYLHLLQASFGGYVSSISTNNSEYQQRWSAYIFFQLPRLLASSIETQVDNVKQAIENFLLHNEYLLNRIDELCEENVLEQILHTTLNYTKNDVREKYENKINELISDIQNIRGPYVKRIQEYYRNQQTHSYSFQILQLQRSLEQSLYKLFLVDSSSNNEENLQLLINNLTDYIPLICALDQYYSFIRLLLSYTETQFDLALLILCYLTSITDDISEDFGHLDLKYEKSSTSYIIYIWLKKYWLSRHIGHALFSSSLDSIELMSPITNLLGDMSSKEKEEFLNEIRTSNNRNVQRKYTDTEYLFKTIYLLGELPSLSLDETKQSISALIIHLTQVSYGTLVHVLLWLIANYQISNDDERIWVQKMIHTMGTSADSTSTIHSLFDAIKRQLWSDFIDNPILPYHTLLPPISSSSIVNYYTPSSPQTGTATTIILTLFDTYLTNEFLDCEQARGLYICSKHVPVHLILTRLLTNINTSNGIYETRRALYFIFGFTLFRRRSSTRCLLQYVLPYLINIKSNEFMLEPNVYSMCLLLNILLVLELNINNDELGDLFRVKSWKKMYQTVDSMSFDTLEDNYNDLMPKYEETSVLDAFHEFLDSSSKELFSSDSVRPVNYFLGWLQTILWMFSRKNKSLKQFIKPKLIAQLSEYLPLQFPIEKVLSILDLSNNIELEYASMAITRDYTRLQTFTKRMALSLIHNQQTVHNENNVATPVTITKTIYTIPKNL
ncbi:unnamed protein product [Rotaria magnacalcarata]|uniref:Uncharacterized protein n=1 Tax=Rotaria magnacalcarata TaxID=392030 RepID=A0A816RF20_9BILA|nr:unnamed protein product [Rotaria magnacalcarata]CAF2070429.1 unnamed protein product [Rotaria magnacalcarata]CAF3945200.1 unnamed protein product [Rotaria magnacalcarata]CAF4009074.1 unnamed protein product [Rotaria magnacalcarata]